MNIQGKQPRSTTLTAYEAAAMALREGWLLAKGKNFQGAVTKVREASNGPLHPIQKAEMLYWVATYLHQFDPALASDAYKAVFAANTKFPRPEQVADRKFARLTDQAVAVCQMFNLYASANAALARLDEVKAKLSYGNTAETVEQGLHELGELLGAASSRPEKETGRGPDVLWLFDSCGACIEAKSEKSAPIHKSDAAQLVFSAQWCDEQLAAGTPTPVPVFATNVIAADRDEDIAFGPRLLDEAVLMDLLDRLRKVVLSLTYDGPLFTDPATIAQRLTEHGVNGGAIVSRLPTMKG